MLTKLFNCPTCLQPFDCKTGEPRTPVLEASRAIVFCRTCTPKATHKQQCGLMDFLDQPAFKKTDDGYEYTLPITDPKCFGCEEEIKVIVGSIAFPASCGHTLCKGCATQQKAGRAFFCNRCTVNADTSDMRTLNSLLAAFSHVARNDQIEALVERLTAGEKEIEALKAAKVLAQPVAPKNADTPIGAERTARNCASCGIEQPVERLYNCEDCTTINCGNCSFDSHQGHEVVKLIGVALATLEKGNDKRYTETIQGLRGNLQYVQKGVNEAVEKVLAAGKDCLAQVKECTKYDEAQDIVTMINDAADEFEKHCEVYIPVARESATQLTELSERLVQEKKK